MEVKDNQVHFTEAEAGLFTGVPNPMPLHELSMFSLASAVSAGENDINDAIMAVDYEGPMAHHRLRLLQKAQKERQALVNRIEGELSAVAFAAMDITPEDFIK